jgi:DNA-binding XRE family transcriptional regulator
LAKLIGVDASTIGAWEENEHVPNTRKTGNLRKKYLVKKSFHNEGSIILLLKNKTERNEDNVFSFVSKKLICILQNNFS